jgi:putative adhesin
MRVSTVVGVGLLLPALLAPCLAEAEVTKTLKVPYAGDPTKPFAIENLAGTMKVSVGSSDQVVVIATVHAESQDLADLMRLEAVTTEKGVPALRMRYPLDRHETIRYASSDAEGHKQGWWSGRHGHSNLKYDGHRVKVSGSKGVLLYADLDVQVPRKAIEATFRNHVGSLDGEGLEGTIRFDTGSGDIKIAHVKGDIVADTGSGDVKASALEGVYRCDTGSGDCIVSGFEGDSLKCDTGSGGIRITSARARAIDVDTGSGDVQVEGADAERFDADTGSGDIEFETRGSRLAHVKADTGSGDVTLRLDPEATFEARADQGSGSIVSRFSGSEPILNKREVVGYRRGDGKLRIRVDTGSGDVVLEPRK